MEPFRPVRTVSRATGGGGGLVATAVGCAGGGGGGGGAVVVPAHAAATSGSNDVRTASTRRKSLDGMMLSLRRCAIVTRRRVRLHRGVAEKPPGRPNSRSR